MIIKSPCIFHLTQFSIRTNHIEVNCHFIKEKIASGCMTTSFVQCFKTGPVIEKEKLLVHGSMVGLVVEPRSNR